MPDILRAFAVCLGLWAVTSCGSVEGPYRTTRLNAVAEGGAAPVCTPWFDLGAANRENTVAQGEARLRCALQNHLLPGGTESRQALARALIEGRIEDRSEPGTPRMVDGVQQVPLPTNDWTTLAAAQPVPRVLRRSDRYTLAFVEIDDKGRAYVGRTEGADGKPLPQVAGPDRPEWQLPQLLAHLRDRDVPDQRHYVITYMHGWRHDAELRDGDLVKFRRMLGYARAALNARCVAVGEYCDTRLTGVVLGWNGRGIDEGPSDSNVDAGGGAGPAVLTFWDRWKTACALGGGRALCFGKRDPKFTDPTWRVLKQIEGALRLGANGQGQDRMLVVGHSMGGNILGSMLRDRAERAVRNHPRGGEMPPLLGDLVVLLNPAAIAEEWTGIQRAERARAGLGNSRYLGCAGPDGARLPDCDPARLAQFHALYPARQRPIYISLTATGDWGDVAHDVQSDTATGSVFPAAQLLNAGAAGPERRTAIGHLTPRYDAYNTLSAGTAEEPNPPVGSSHEVAVLRGSGAFTRYGGAMKPDTAWCAPGNGWLLHARSMAGGLKRDWDYGYVPVPKGAAPVASRNLGGHMNPASIRWRQSISTKAHGRALSVSPATSPFWNVRALDTTIRGHAAWANYPIWCAFHQMVLDNPTASQWDVPPGIPEAEALWQAERDAQQAAQDAQQASLTPPAE